MIIFEEENLALSNLEDACNEELLNSNEIKSILSLISYDTDMKIYSGINYKRIDVLDECHEDLLTYFDEISDFIRSSLANEKRVLVHCFQGVSRSVTAISAYFMNRLSTPDFTQVQKLLFRHIGTDSVYNWPNKGFEQQLLLYETLLHSRHSSEYHNYLNYAICSRVKQCQATFEDEKLQRLFKILFQSQHVDQSSLIRCRKCRQILVKNRCDILESTFETNNNIAIAIQPWIKQNSNVYQQKSGRIICPKCQTNIGRFQWSLCDLRFSSGFSAPVFRLAKGNIDLMERHLTPTS